MSNSEEKKGSQHWTPVWDGLFADESGKHHKKMGKAIWLFLYILNRCRADGKTTLKIETMSKSTGIPLSTVKRYLGKLRKGNYITTVSNGKSLVITVNNWRPIGKSLRNIQRGGGFKSVGEVIKKKDPFEDTENLW